MAYILDSNIFIQAKNSVLSFDICPGFWQWLIIQNQTKQLFSIEKVGDELKIGNDELSKWARTRTSGFFLKPDTRLPTTSKL